MKVLNNLVKSVLLFFIGGLLYYLIEIAWRGHSHWTMFCLGGACFVCIGLINEILPWEMPLWKQGIVGALIITVLEFAVGCIVNIALGWNVWDYSDVPFNIHGQICLPFSVLWFAISLIAIVLDDYIRYWAFDEERPKYKIL